MSEKNKKVLTIEDLKKLNKTGKVYPFFMVLFTLIFIITACFTCKDLFRVVNKNFHILLVFFTFGPPLWLISFSIKAIKTESKENIAIENSDFKIVEDQIYDKNVSITSDSNGDTHYNYYIFSKIYGKISTGVLEYNNAQKHDMVYLLFYNGNENIENYNFETDEHERNSEIVDQKYLATEYELSPELKMYLVAYNEKLGNINFDKRINEQLNKLKNKKGKIDCRNCNTKYKIKKQTSCPNCGTVYNFDIIDVMHEKEWYK